MQTKSKRMIFHFPLPIQEDGATGTFIRSREMLDAFHDIGYEVTAVTGRSKERRRVIKEIKSEVENGANYQFIYSESANIPTLLSEPHHLPLNPFLDFGFFQWMRSRDVPVGLFYRDIHWMFTFYKDLIPLYKRMVLLPFFKYDLKMYPRVLDHLFVPSMDMIDRLPGTWDPGKVSTLYPGWNNKIRVGIIEDKNNIEELRLFYVGGILPPLYDIRPALKAIAGLHNVSLTICCKLSEWEIARESKDRDLFSGVKVVQARGQELAQYYRDAHVFLLFREYHPYLSFAMQLKIFESIGYGLPIITNSGTVSSNFISEKDIGWDVGNVKELGDLLKTLRDGRQLINEKSANVYKIRYDHTWEERAKFVEKVLTEEVGG